MSDPFSTCDCGQPLTDEPFCSACSARLPTLVRGALRAALHDRALLAFRTAFIAARKALAT